MKKWIRFLTLAIFVMAAAPVFAADSCPCNESCQKTCSKGHADACGCKHCDCKDCKCDGKAPKK